MRIIFMGTPDLAVEVIDSLYKSDHEIVGVVTQQDKRQGRSQKISSPPVKVYAEARKIPVYQPRRASEDEVIDELKLLKPDLIVVAAYGQILSEKLLNIAPYGSINVHTSLLPKYRGAAPIQRSIIQGEKKTGVTIMRMVKELDAGAILMQGEVAIDHDDDNRTLGMKLAKLGSELTLQTITQIEKGQLKEVEQDHQKATYAHKISVEEAKINWNQEAHLLHDFIRGLSPAPGAWASLEIRGKKKRVKLAQTHVLLGDFGSPGDLTQEGKTLIVACEKNALQIGAWQVEGKSWLDAKSFLAGFSLRDLRFDLS